MRQVFVNSLPKSGTNLLAKCLLLFGYTERGHISAGSVLDKNAASLVRRMLWGSAASGYSIGINVPVSVRKFPIDLKLWTLRRNQFITAHVGYDSRLLESVVKNDIVPVQMLRDPRAVLASFVPYVLQDKNHFLQAEFADLSNEERYRIALAGGTFNGRRLNSMSHYCGALSPWVNSEDVLKVRFEDLVGSSGGGCDVRRGEVLQLLADKLDLPEEKISSVAENLYGPGRHTFRKGHIDSWKEELPASLLEDISVELSEILKAWGYDS